MKVLTLNYCIDSSLRPEDIIYVLEAREIITKVNSMSFFLLLAIRYCVVLIKAFYWKLCSVLCLKRGNDGLEFFPEVGQTISDN